MTVRLSTRLGVACLCAAGAAAAAGCDTSPTEPEVQHPIAIAMDFCATRMPIWFAHLNQGEEWTRVLPSASGTFSFTASNRVMVAYVYQTGADVEAEILAVANTELEMVSGRTCLDETGTKSVSGTVAGVSLSSQYSRVGMGVAGVVLLSHQTSFGLTSLPDRALDLVASRFGVSGNAQLADRMIIRRNLNPASGSTLPLVDFGSNEAFFPAGGLLNLTGVLTGDDVRVINNLFTANGTSQILSDVTGTANGAFPYSAVPSSAQAAGDSHVIFANAFAGDGSFRGAQRFFGAPATSTLPLGPPLSAVTITTVASAPYVRLRAEFGSQLDYSGFVSAEYVQNFQQLSTTKVTIFATPGFFRGRPSTWSVDIPDFSGTSGWQNGWGLQTGTNIDWAVSGVGGRSDFLFGAAPADGEVIRYGVRTSAGASVRRPNPMAAFARTTARPRPPFSPAR
jgi:hypothetical protein